MKATEPLIRPTIEEFDWQRLTIQESHVSAVLKKHLAESRNEEAALGRLRAAAVALYHRICGTLELTGQNSALIELAESSRIPQSDVMSAGEIIVQSLKSHFEALGLQQNPKWDAKLVADMRHLAVCILTLCVYHHKKLVRSQINAAGIPVVARDSASGDMDALEIEVDVEQIINPGAFDPTPTPAPLPVPSLPPAPISSTGAMVIPIESVTPAYSGTVPPADQLAKLTLTATPRRPQARGFIPSTPAPTKSTALILMAVAAIGFAATIAIKKHRQATAISTHNRRAPLVTLASTPLPRAVIVPAQAPTLPTPEPSVPVPQVVRIESSGRFVSPDQPNRALFEIGIRAALVAQRSAVQRCLSETSNTPHLISGLTRNISDQLISRGWHVGNPALETGITLRWVDGDCTAFHVTKWQINHDARTTLLETEVTLAEEPDTIARKRALLHSLRTR